MAGRPLLRETWKFLTVDNKIPYWVKNLKLLCEIILPIKSNKD